MHEEELAQVPELTDGDIRRSRCLQAFDTTDTNPDMRSLDHADVVGAISYGEEVPVASNDSADGRAKTAASKSSAFAKGTVT